MPPRLSTDVAQAEHLPRGTYGFTVGFPMQLCGDYKRRAIARGLTVVDVRERPGPHAPGCKARRPVEVLVPQHCLPQALPRYTPPARWR